MESPLGQLLIILFVVFTIFGFIGVFRVVLIRAEEHELRQIPKPYENKKNR